MRNVLGGRHDYATSSGAACAGGRPGTDEPAVPSEAVALTSGQSVIGLRAG
jgi:hypothetical protein